MNFPAALMTPLALLLPALGGVQGAPEVGLGAAEVVVNAAPQPMARATTDRPANPGLIAWRLRTVSRGFEPEPARQVRIEQRVIIRIAPRAEAAQRNIFIELPDHAIGPRFVERKIGECVRANRISGVQTDVGNRLLLFMNDRRIVSATLERSCRARDFYSGFYLSKSKDGNLCVARDTLQSRSGANCKLTQFRELVEIGE